MVLRSQLVKLRQAQSMAAAVQRSKTSVGFNEYQRNLGTESLEKDKTEVNIDFLTALRHTGGRRGLPRSRVATSLPLPESTYQTAFTCYPEETPQGSARYQMPLLRPLGIVTSRPALQPRVDPHSNKARPGNWSTTNNDRESMIQKRLGTKDIVIRAQENSHLPHGKLVNLRPNELNFCKWSHAVRSTWLHAP